MSTAETSLVDRTALVTGASSGIGAAIARALVHEGMRVAVLARRADRLAALVSELQGERPTAELLVLPCDVRDERQILAAFATLRERWGGVDVMVNNAGLGRDAPLVGGASEAWREMLDVNVLALAICTREAIADMRSRGDRGHVVHVSSMAAHRVPEGSGMYSATKFAVRSLTEGLRKELRALGSGIRVSAVSPGFVETEFAGVWSGDPGAGATTYGRYPVLQPEDIAAIVVSFLKLPARAEVHDVLVRPTAQPD
jgi:NADP-dependent 3-hydroxy acid dehydrogenase YdfG